MQGYTKWVPIDTDITLANDSDLLVPSQKAIKTYVDTSISSITYINPIIPLSAQNFYIDTYNWNNQVTNWHREDWTTIVNTYSNNLLQTSVYTFPDNAVVTLTISYDGNDRVISALYS